LKIKQGHNRFDCAKRLNLPIWYIVEGAHPDIDIFHLEAGNSGWSITDFAQARAKAGDTDVIKLLSFKEKHGYSLGAAASLLGGESVGSNHKKKDIKYGTFRLAFDSRYVSSVTRITDVCRKLNIRFATATALVSAISLAVRVSEFNVGHFIQKLELYPAAINKRGTANEYLEEVEALYNYATKKGRLAVSFEAREAAKARSKAGLVQNQKAA
jgi:hypothetical protein